MAIYWTTATNIIKHGQNQANMAILQREEKRHDAVTIMGLDDTLR